MTEPLSPEDRERIVALASASREMPKASAAVGRLLTLADSLAARVSSLEACAQEVRRAWDAREAKCAEYEAWHAKNKRKHDEAGAYQLDDEKEAAEARWQAAIDALVAPVSRRRRSP